MPDMIIRTTRSVVREQHLRKVDPLMWCGVLCVCLSQIANAQSDPVKLPNTVDETIEKEQFRKTDGIKTNRKGNGWKEKKKKSNSNVHDAQCSQKGNPTGLCCLRHIA